MIQQARLDQIPGPYDVDIEHLDPSNAYLFQHQLHWDYFKRLREEDPVHFVESEVFGPYWSITKFKDIMYVDSHHDQFSNEPAITIAESELDFEPPMFIAMDSPKHDVQRAAVTPAVAPMRLSEMESLIRERVCEVLDALPVNEPFDWVDAVSIELTTRMLATLFDFPFEERRKLTYWSDVATASPTVAENNVTEEERRDELMLCLEYFNKLWNERAAAPPKSDLISLLAHDPATKDMDPMEYLGNLILLIVGGNDTTRNSMSGGIWALHENPDQFAKLKGDPSLISNMVSEIIRWQTPLAHMRRIAKEDVELGGKTIKKGDKVVMWYISGNRDEEVIDQPDEFIIDRPKARHHVSFGFGIHRCMGNRLAEMQLRILWEEFLARFDGFEVLGEPDRVPSNFVMGYQKMDVILRPRV